MARRPMGAAERYIRSMRTNMASAEATWLPGDIVDVGDVGVFRHGVFHRMTSLAELGIPYKVEVAATPQDIEYSADAVTEFAPSAAVGAGGVGEVEVEITLHGAGAYVFQASGVRQHAVADRAEVFGAILELAKQRRDWKRRWNVITSVYNADCATVLVSTGNEAKVAFTGTANDLLSPVLLADPRFGLRASVKRGNVIKVVARDGVKPLYTCYRVQQWLFGEPDVVPVTDSDAADPANWFVRPTLSERLAEDAEGDD